MAVWKRKKYVYIFTKRGFLNSSSSNWLQRSSKNLQYLQVSSSNSYYYIPRIRRIGGCYGFTSKPPAARNGAKEGGSHYWEMAVAITCGYGGHLLPLLAAHSSFNWFDNKVSWLDISVYWRLSARHGQFQCISTTFFCQVIGSSFLQLHVFGHRWIVKLFAESFLLNTRHGFFQRHIWMIYVCTKLKSKIVIFKHFFWKILVVETYEVCLPELIYTQIACIFFLPVIECTNLHCATYTE